MFFNLKLEFPETVLYGLLCTLKGQRHLDTQIPAKKCEFLPAAVSPRQVMQFDYTEDQRHSRHDQHEHYEDILLCWPRHVTVDRVWTRPGLRENDND